MSEKPVTIVGGGLAGLSLGLGLRNRGVPAIILEAGTYPRHRVCGEFISGRGQAVLSRLGLALAVHEAGVMPAQTARFVFPRASSPSRTLPAPAWSISRLKLDALLAKHFQDLGGELRQGERWHGETFAEGMVRASGRRVQNHQDKWRWFGLKVHARNLPLEADLEMHALQNGYLGLTRLTDGEVNVCGLFRRRCGESRDSRFDDSSSPPSSTLVTNPAPKSALLLETIQKGGTAALQEQLSKAIFDESSFCSVAGLCLEPQRARALSECCIGDSLTMTPPVTGNGMSMAFEAGEMAVEPLSAWSRGEVSWSTARETIARSCDRHFQPRLRWARCLQWMMFTPVLRGGLGSLVLSSELLWRAMFGRTR